MLLETARTDAGVRTAHLACGDTAYQIHGNAGPWVVLVHGLVTPMYSWDAMAQALAQAGFRVLRYDQLGRGHSARPSVRYDVALYVRQLRELTESLGIERAHFVGWSMGCVINSRFALEHPERVDRHVLIAPGLFVDAPLALRMIGKLPLAARLLARLVGTFIARLPAQHLVHPERFPDYGRRMHEQRRFPGLGESFASTILNYEFGERPEYRAVGAHSRPVLLLWGDLDVGTPYANARRVQELYPRAELVTFTGAKHAPHVDHAERANQVVIDFLRRPA
jgi:pimeloyl-ACP methyl ester carboxylesterase